MLTLSPIIQLEPILTPGPILTNDPIIQLSPISESLCINWLSEKDFFYFDHQKPYWQQCRERIRRLWNIPVRQEYIKYNKGEKDEN